MSKDLLDDQYGRFYALPQELARLGHQVKGVCLSYRLKQEGHLAGPEINNTLVDWYSVNIGRSVIPGLYSYSKIIRRLCCDFKPEIIVACSDALHVIIAYILTQKFSISCVADLYDNFESFGLTKTPGILPLFKKSVRCMAGVTCVSTALEKYVKEQYNPRGKVVVLPNGIREKQFRPINQRQCRKDLGLPLDAKLIGTAGALDVSRGIDVLFEAAGSLIAEDSSIHLVVAGPMGAGIVMPQGDNIHYIGELEYRTIPALFNALDVGVICNRDSLFGRYCFPQKAYEMLACDLSVVAADVGVMSEMFKDYPECLFSPESQQSLVQAIRRQLVFPTSPDVEIATWTDLAKEMEGLLLEIMG